MTKPRASEKKDARGAFAFGQSCGSLVRVSGVRNQGQSVSLELELRFEDCSKFDAAVRYN
jgi:hypothetical protein